MSDTEDQMPGASCAGDAGLSGETIRIFGFSQLAPAVLQCLEQFCRYGMTVKLYHLVPSGEFYEDCKTHKEELREFLKSYFREGQEPNRIQDGLKDLYFQHNPLLASFAMQNRVLLNRTGEWIDDTDFGYDGEQTVDEGTILHRLQKRIREDLKPAAVQPEKRKKGSGCRSVQIRNCYSAFREVEAAYNFVLHCLDEDHDLQGKDIFIMSPSPADYAPLVDAVFNHSDSTMRLGVSIADQPRTERLPEYTALMKALALFKGDFTATEIFSILQDQALQKQWGFAPDDCQYCLNRAMKAGIRWGWDAADHGRSGGKAFPENSWQTGFDRMLLDYAMDADPLVPYQINENETLFPVPGFEGGRADLLGRFASLVSKLHEIAQTMRGWERNGVPFREWEPKLSAWAGYLFGGDSELKKTLAGVLSIWQKELKEADTEDVPLTGGIILAYLQDKHAKPEDNTMGFMRGKITFCGLRPMRSIPADMILLLGMNHRAFPEEDDAMEFDIMRQYRKNGKVIVGREPGDPLRRDESRQLFLDTIMAARKYLYISYIGRDIHDRKEKPPSVCVDELGNYLTQEFGKNSFIELKEPLHAFSPELFADGAANQSFSAKMRDAAVQVAASGNAGMSGRSGTEDGEGEKPLFDIRGGIRPDDHTRQDPPCPRIELEDLRRFFSNPADRFVRNRLDANMSVQETTSPEDSEPFESSLDWDTKDELLRLYLESADRDALKRDSLRRLKADGSVPLTQNMDDWADWSDIASIAQAMESAVEGMSGHVIPAGEKEFEYSAEDLGELAGLVYDTVPDGVFRTALILPDLKAYRSADGNTPHVRMAWSFGNISGAQLIAPTLDHIRANLITAMESRFLYFNSKHVIEVAKADAMEPDEARRVMKQFLCLYHAGMWKPLPFFPNTSYAYFGAEDGKKAQAAETGWHGGWNGKGDADKFGNYFGTSLRISDCFKGLAGAFFGSAVFHSVSQAERKKKK